jgi:large subunit ribosomal protein L21e
MTRASKGFRHGTRHKLKGKSRSKFKPQLYIPDFKVDEKVLVVQNPSSQKGMPHLRFRGLMGKIVEKRGAGYMVELKAGGKTKQIIAKGEHLKAVKV